MNITLAPALQSSACDRGGVETGLGESLKQVGFHRSAVQPIGEFHHVALHVFGLDFVMSSQEKPLEI